MSAQEELRKYLCQAHWEIAPQKAIDTCLECAAIEIVENTQKRIALLEGLLREATVQVTLVQKEWRDVLIGRTAGKLLCRMQAALKEKP